MCMDQKEKNTRLFDRNESSHKLWARAFPDPRIMDDAFEKGLAKVHELALQESNFADQ